MANTQGEILDLTCGDWSSSHEKACETYAENNTVELAEKRDVVIVSCGGFPHDLNMIQAHKALDMASHACKDSGTIIFLASCENGLGRDDFINWFDSNHSAELGERLCEKYQVNGQTAWSLLKKAENFDIQIVTELPIETTKLMRLSKIDKLSDALAKTENSEGYILPFGAKLKIQNG